MKKPGTEVEMLLVVGYEAEWPVAMLRWCCAAGFRCWLTPILKWRQGPKRTPSSRPALRSTQKALLTWDVKGLLFTRRLFAMLRESFNN